MVDARIRYAGLWKLTLKAGEDKGSGIYPNSFTPLWRELQLTSASHITAYPNDCMCRAAGRSSLSRSGNYTSV
jgi:hypothetical protein